MNIYSMYCKIVFHIFIASYILEERSP